MDTKPQIPKQRTREISVGVALYSRDLLRRF